MHHLRPAALVVGGPCVLLLVPLAFTQGPDRMERAEAIAKSRFPSLDTNGDGKISREEAEADSKRNWNSRLFAEFDKHDKDRNGSIDLAEYIGYMKERFAPRAREKEKAADKPPADLVDGRPVVYRFGKLPPGLPEWFAELDEDKDGQVALYEWRAGGKAVADFRKLDLDGDGLITAEEVLRGKRARGRELTLAEAIAIAERVGKGRTLRAERREGSDPYYRIDLVGPEGQRTRIEVAGDGRVLGKWEKEKRKKE